MRVTFYSSLDPRRLTDRSGFKSLADIAPVLSQNGEGITIDSQGESSYDNIVPVYRDLTLSGKIKSSFELHGPINVVLDHAKLTNSENAPATIKIADDFTGTLKIIDSNVYFKSNINNGLAIGSSIDYASRPENITVQNSTVEGIAAIPIQFTGRGRVELDSKSQEGFSAINASNYDLASAKLMIKYGTFINANANAAKVLELDCLAGPVELNGSWEIGTLGINSSNSMELFRFIGDKIPTSVSIKRLNIEKINKGISAFYAKSADLHFNNAFLGDDKVQATVAVDNSRIYMSNTKDYLTWETSNQNALDLDDQSLTKLRMMKNQFLDIKQMQKDQSQQTKQAIKNSNSDNLDDFDPDNISDQDETNDSNTIADKPGDAGIAAANDANKVKKEDAHDDIGQADGMAQLNQLIGLNSVKKTLQKFINIAIMNKRLAERNLKQATDLSRHMVFAGNPGTGKTTVAEIVAQILYEQGALRENKCVEVTSQNVISDHIGGTAKAMHEAVENARGGVLFIDEAYMLDSNKNSNKFAQDAADTLMRDMEKYHKDLIVILAGYEKPMRDFLKHANPGLSSRFTYWVHFPDYTQAEEIKIMQLMLNKQGLIINPSYFKTKTFLWNLKFYNRDHSNGRSVRNYYQALVSAHANRLVKFDPSTLSDEQMMTITAAEIKAVSKEAVATLKYEKEHLNEKDDEGGEQNG